MDEKKPRVAFPAKCATGLGKRGSKEGLELVISIQKVKNDHTKLKEALEDGIGVIEKVGKRKNGIGGEKGLGMAVKVVVKEEDIEGQNLTDDFTERTSQCRGIIGILAPYLSTLSIIGRAVK